MTAEQVIENLTAENDLVVDPMSGSATTGTAAKRTRRPLAGDRSQAADRARQLTRLARQEELGPQDGEGGLHSSSPPADSANN